jgi:hypothetical protein
MNLQRNTPVLFVMTLVALLLWGSGVDHHLIACFLFGAATFSTLDHLFTWVRGKAVEGK